MNYYLQGSKKLYLIKLNFDIPVYQLESPLVNKANVIEKTQGKSSRALRSYLEIARFPDHDSGRHSRRFCALVLRYQMSLLQ